MSTHVVGIVPPDDEYKAMETVWRSCEAAKIPIPQKVYDFFDGVEPDGKGVAIEIPKTVWGDDSRSGFEIEVAKIPSHVKLIRFYNGY